MEKGNSDEIQSSHPTTPTIHGHGGHFHLHAGHLEYVTGDADMDPNAPAAGMSSEELDKQPWSTPDGFSGLVSETVPDSPRPVEHVPGHGGHFHIHASHLEYVVGDADTDPNASPAGLSSEEVDKRPGYSSDGISEVLSTTLPDTPRPVEHVPGHGGHFHIHGGHLEYVIGDADLDPTTPAAGITTEELNKSNSADVLNDSAPSSAANETPKPVEHVKGHGGHFHIHGGHLEYVVGDADSDPNAPAAGMSTDELDKRPGYDLSGFE